MGLFWRFQRLLFKKILRNVEIPGVHPRQIPLLMMISKNEGLPQRELAKKLDVEPSSMAIMMKRLEKAGFVKRKRDEEDARILRIYPTERVFQTIERIHRIVGEIEKEVFSILSDEERKIFKGILERLVDHLSR